MYTENTMCISNFVVTGINYQKTDAVTRGLFAINAEQYGKIIELANSFHVDGLFVLSTCNRTEIYGFAENADKLASLLCSQTIGDTETFNNLCYLKKGVDAVEHLFNVAAGLDSQILGDYEIIGQLKQAVKFSRDRNGINCFLERLFNCVLQSSKMIKNQTALSSGAVSVSFAAVQYIKANSVRNNNNKILVIGIGKIGRNTCKNLVDYLGNRNITLINRTAGKAAELANQLNLSFALIDDLAGHIAAANIILVATNALTPVVLKEHLENKGKKLIIDLSIPKNVETSAGDLHGITLVDVDKLSKIKDETLLKRKTEIPKAKEIIACHQACFMEWYNMRKNIPLLAAIKSKLNEIYSRAHGPVMSAAKSQPVIIAEDQIQRVVNGAAFKMRTQNQQGCYYIEAINEFMGIPQI